MTAATAFAERDPEPLVTPARGWIRWLGPAISLAILIVVLHAYSQFELRTNLRNIPHSFVFWIVFAAYYLSTPAWEWIIYRRLWTIPGSGFVALLRKHITNEMLLGYLGEVYFYSWVRDRGRITNAPFGAIKDVSILSAVCGNVVTLAALPFGITLLQSLSHKITPSILALSIAAYLATSFVPIILRRRVFSLPREQLWFVARTHFLRVVLTMLLYAGLWHMMLPAVTVSWWLMLAVMRQLVSRLPLVPNKEILFVGIAEFVLGRRSEIIALMALLGSFVLLLHIMIGLVLGASGMIDRGQT